MLNGNKKFNTAEKRKVEIVMSYYTCPDCHGTGKVRWGRVKVECPCCDGTGEVPYIECPKCGGRGKTECACTGERGIKAADPNCPDCGGSGMRTCAKCKGTGKLK